MNRTPLPQRRLALAPSLLIALTALSLVTSGSASAASKASPALTPVDEFNSICGELTEARLRLERGDLADVEFEELVLGLFLRADSLAGVVATLPNGGTSPLGLQRATAYLIDSLRENWVGMAAQNGLSFAEADLALKAAVAWKSSEATAALVP